MEASWGGWAFGRGEGLKMRQNLIDIMEHVCYYFFLGETTQS